MQIIPRLHYVFIQAIASLYVYTGLNVTLTRNMRPNFSPSTLNLTRMFDIGQLGDRSPNVPEAARPYNNVTFNRDQTEYKSCIIVVLAEVILSATLSALYSDSNPALFE